MSPFKEIIPAKEIALDYRRSLYTDYNHEVNFLITIILIEALSVLLIAFV